MKSNGKSDFTKEWNGLNPVMGSVSGEITRSQVYGDGFQLN